MKYQFKRASLFYNSTTIIRFEKNKKNLSGHSHPFFSISKRKKTQQSIYHVKEKSFTDIYKIKSQSEIRPRWILLTAHFFAFIHPYKITSTKAIITSCSIWAFPAWSCSDPLLHRTAIHRSICKALRKVWRLQYWYRCESWPRCLLSLYWASATAQEVCVYEPNSACVEKPA